MPCVVWLASHKLPLARFRICSRREPYLDHADSTRRAGRARPQRPSR